jgi:hypothetical protein
MRTITIEAASLKSARGFASALTGFETTLDVINERVLLSVKIHGDREIIAVLHALESHINERSESALLELEDRRFQLGDTGFLSTAPLPVD